MTTKNNNKNNRTSGGRRPKKCQTWKISHIHKNKVFDEIDMLDTKYKKYQKKMAAVKVEMAKKISILEFSTRLPYLKRLIDMHGEPVHEEEDGESVLIIEQSSASKDENNSIEEILTCVFPEYNVTFEEQYAECDWFKTTYSLFKKID
jgi:hypothetical protein